MRHQTFQGRDAAKAAKYKISGGSARQAQDAEDEERRWWEGLDDLTLTHRDLLVTRIPRAEFHSTPIMPDAIPKQKERSAIAKYIRQAAFLTKPGEPFTVTRASDSARTALKGLLDYTFKRAASQAFNHDDYAGSPYARKILVHLDSTVPYDFMVAPNEKDFTVAEDQRRKAGIYCPKNPDYKRKLSEVTWCVFGSHSFRLT